LADNVDDVPFVTIAIAKRLAKAGHVNPEVTGVHDQAAPHMRDQFPLADDLASALDQYHQNVERTIAQRERDAVFFEGASSRE
jgi:hypothetical protein